MTLTSRPPVASRSSAGRALRLVVVSAWPPSRDSRNGYGFHLVEALADQSDVAGVHVIADSEAMPPVIGTKVTAQPCWTLNSWTNALLILRAIRANRPDAVIFNLQFATFGDRKVPGALGLLAPWLVKRSGIPTTVLLHNLGDDVDMQGAGFTESPLVAGAAKLAGRIATKALLRADFVVVTIPRYVQFLQDKYGARNVLLAAHGSSTEDSLERRIELEQRNPAAPAGIAICDVAFWYVVHLRRLADKVAR